MTSTKMKTAIAGTLALVLASGGLAGLAYAHERHGDLGNQEAVALANAKVTLLLAVAAAEQATGGKAVEAGIENQNGTAIFYDVTVLKADGLFYQALVDMQTGQVKVVLESDRDGDGEKSD
ncbi:MAG TPA: hypothetical protein VIM74_10765 [Casimicrobiaceae bacterium]|jgi:uncharacterized membrane protein YkoI